MTKDEFAYWQSRIENSRFRWTEDEIYRLNGRGAFYYTGGEDGIYIKIHKNGRFEAGTYEGAFPHIGEALFTVEAERRCKDYNEAFAPAMQAGGKQFVLDMFSPDAVPPPAIGEKPSVPEQIKASREAPRHPGNGRAVEAKRQGRAGAMIFTTEERRLLNIYHSGSVRDTVSVVLDALPDITEPDERIAALSILRKLIFMSEDEYSGIAPESEECYVR
jgi:hypothetical protein